MNYKVLLVDDEPTALQNLSIIIEKHCPDFQVIGSCEDGVDALNFINTYTPDILMTDIKMPRMDGLALAKELYTNHPHVKIIIVSGHQDFEYARTAIKYNVIDYLLKPVLPRDIKDTFQRMIPQLKAITYQSGIEILRKVVNCNPANQMELSRYFPARSYISVLTRKNSLPSRFTLSSANEISSDKNDTFVLYGRDEMESLSMCPTEKITVNELTMVSQKPYIDSAGFITSVVWHGEFGIERICEVIKKMYQALNMNLVIGLSQVVYVDFEQSGYPQRSCNDSWSESMMKQIVCEPNYLKQKQLLHYMLNRWQAEQRPQYWVENRIRKLLDRLQLPEIEFTKGQVWDFMLEDAFFYAVGFDDLWESLCYMLDKVFLGSDDNKTDSIDFFEPIRLYVDTHLAEPVTIQKLCQMFGISQPYLSRLFRKYTTLTFSQYLTSIRMDRAKEILTSDRNILIKNLAVTVGYSDQYYFSRTFSSFFGKPPTEYMYS